MKNDPPKGEGVLVGITVVNGNEEFYVPLDKGKLATVEAVCQMAEIITGYNVTFTQTREVTVK